MNITRENIDNVNAVIKILIEKEDYEKSVEDTLKDYRKKSSIPGFRPGKAPAGLIKKKFGKAVLADEINKILSQKLSGYLIDEKLKILGEPLPSAEKQTSIDWDKDENFEFAFDVALAPEVEVSIDKEDKLDYFTIKVSKDMVDKQVEMVQSQMGQNVESDEVKDKNLIRGNFVQLDDEGKEIEDGIKADGVVISIDFIKEEEIKKLFLGKKKKDVVSFDPVAAYQDRKEVSRLLNISKEQAEKLNSKFNFTIVEILEFKKADLNEELFKKIYGEDTEVKTEEDLKKRLKNEIGDSLKQSSDRKFATDVRDKLVKKVNPELPESFLKRWLKEANKEITEEQVEKEFDLFLTDIRWQLIKETIVKDNSLKVEEEEAKEFAKKIAQMQYSQYGIFNAPDDQLESFAKMLLEKPEEKERLYSKLLEDKVIDVVKDKVTIDNKEVTTEEFEKLGK